MLTIKKVIGIALAICLLSVSLEAKNKKKVKDWQTAVAQVTEQVQTVENQAADNLSKASKQLTSQIEQVQASLSKEIESVADQVQEVQKNLNDFISKYNKAK